MADVPESAEQPKQEQNHDHQTDSEMGTGTVTPPVAAVPAANSEEQNQDQQ
jgi:hypothetical protein